MQSSFIKQEGHTFIKIAAFFSVCLEFYTMLEIILFPLAPSDKFELINPHVWKRSIGV